MPENPEVEVILGGDASKKYKVTLGDRPGNLSQAAAGLQQAFRQTAGGPAALRRARVAILDQDKRLVVVPGGLREKVTFMPGGTADSLGLSGGTESRAYLSGVLHPFPKLTSDQPAVKLSLDAVEHAITLSSRPAGIQEAAAVLAAAIQQAGAEPTFTQAKVTVLENQLLILLGEAQTAKFLEATRADQTKDPALKELQLFAQYPIRVRVNGAESLDSHYLEMP